MTALGTLWLSAYLLVVLGLSAFGLHRLVTLYRVARYAGKKPVPHSRFDVLPAVTVQLPVFNERLVIRRLLRAVARLDYPRHLLQIQILDDSTDETVEICESEARRLHARGFEVELRQRAHREGFKAGALQAGMASARGEYIFILDADFVPAPGLLQEVIHYFTDAGVGMVQTRWGHLNRNYSLLTRLQAIFLDGHFLLEHAARHGSGCFFNFNGTAGMWRKRAVIDAGGWEADTLTEDLDLSYRAQLNGWKFVYLRDVVTDAEIPPDIGAFKTQQHRWTKGSVQSCRKLLVPIWMSRSPLKIKLEATAHLAANFSYLLLAALCVLLYPARSGASGSAELGNLLTVPVIGAATLSVGSFYWYALRVSGRGRRWRELCYLPLLLALGVGMAVNNARAVVEALCRVRSGFVRTPKYGFERATSGEGAPPSQLESPRMPARGFLNPVLESALAGYFLFLTWESAANAHWLALPFLALFAGGFLAVALGTWAGIRRVPRRARRGGGGRGASWPWSSARGTVSAAPEEG